MNCKHTMMSATRGICAACQRVVGHACVVCHWYINPGYPSATMHPTCEARP